MQNVSVFVLCHLARLKGSVVSIWRLVGLSAVSRYVGQVSEERFLDLESYQARSYGLVSRPVADCNLQ
jgi:hypothetical protein